MKRGFTVLELVMVILVVAILAVVTTVRMPDLTNTRIRLAAKKIQSDIRYAQRLAMNTQLRTAMRFDIATDTYFIQIESNALWPPAKDPLSQKDFVVRLNTAEYQGVDIALACFNGCANNTLIFDSKGIPYALRQSSVERLSTTGGVCLNTWDNWVTVAPNTGYVGVVP